MTTTLHPTTTTLHPTTTTNYPTTTCTPAPTKYAFKINGSFDSGLKYKTMHHANEEAMTYIYNNCTSMAEVHYAIYDSKNNWTYCDYTMPINTTTLQPTTTIRPTKPVTTTNTPIPTPTPINYKEKYEGIMSILKAIKSLILKLWNMI